MESHTYTNGTSVIEEDRHWWFASRTRALLGIMDRYLPSAEGRRVLDVGCGAGNMFHHLARYGLVEGIDTNPKPLEVARSRGYTVQHSAGERMPYEADIFDLVAALDVVEHVDDDPQLLAECARVLRPGGYLIVTTPAFQWLWSHNDEVNGHRRRYTRQELCAKLEGAGLRVRRATYNNFAIFLPAAALIVLRRAMAKEPELAVPSDEDAYQVEMEPANPIVNTVLGAVGALEATVLRGMNLPAGTSLIALAQKPA